MVSALTIECEILCGLLIDHYFPMQHVDVADS